MWYSLVLSKKVKVCITSCATYSKKGIVYVAMETHKSSKTCFEINIFEVNKGP